MSDLPPTGGIDVEAVRTEFLELVTARSIAGGINFGERSFDAKGHHLCDEIAEELADIASWGIPLYGRLMRLRQLIERLEATHDFLEELRKSVGVDARRGHGNSHGVTSLVHRGLTELGM